MQIKRRLGTHTSNLYRHMRQQHVEFNSKWDYKSSMNKSLDSYCNCSLSWTRISSPSESGWCHNLSARVQVELGCILLV